MKKIAVFLENKKPNILASVGLELLSETKRIIHDEVVEIVGIWFGSNLTLDQQALVQKTGAHKLILIENEELYDYDTQRYTTNLEAICKKENFDVLLIGSSILGRDLAPRLSARLKTGLTADATKLDFELTDDKLTLLATRPALGGNIFATIICPRTTPQMATIRPNVFKVSSEYNSHLIRQVEQYTPVKAMLEIVKKTPAKAASVDLTKAKLIISGGRGVADKFESIKELAGVLNTEYASSRALVDGGVSPRSRLVGQTGTTVQPKVYLSFGISGAIQHLAGMDKSDMIIAINNDPTANIFEVADVGIVSDAKEVLPLLINRIKEIKESK